MVNVWAEWQTCEANGTAMREVDPAKDPFVDIESQPGLLAEGLVIPQEWKGTFAENVLRFFFYLFTQCLLLRVCFSQSGCGCDTGRRSGVSAADRGGGRVAQRTGQHGGVLCRDVHPVGVRAAAGPHERGTQPLRQEWQHRCVPWA